MKKIYPLFQKENIVFLVALLFVSTVFTQQFTKLTDILPVIAREARSATWVDYDEDGDLDLFVSGGVSPNNLQGYHYLFQNNCNGEFTKIIALPDGVANDRGKTWLDIDNDGDIDLYIPQRAVYYNNGDGTFSKNTTINIIAFGEKTRGHSFADIDNDGDLDLFLANDARNLGPQNDILYFHNNGNGTYTQVTTGDVVNDGLLSETGIWGDYDSDGDMDLFVTIVASGTFIGFHHLLYTNDGTGNFIKVITGPIATDLCTASGANWIDYDNDMDLDLFVYNVFGIPIRLYQNDGVGNFVDMVTPAGISIHPLGNDHTWGDYDNDGDLDLFISSINSHNFLYSNNGNGTFTQNTSEILSNDNLVESYGAQWADYDNDGDLDLFVPNAFGAPASFFYRNNGNANHWIDIKLTGTTSNTAAIGARIFLKATIGGTLLWQMHEVNANLSSSSAGPNLLNQHFGLGDATIIDSLKIVWPASHTSQVFTNVTPDRFIKITEGVNAITEANPCKPDLLPINPAVITGNILEDVNNDCIGDFAIPNRIVQTSPGKFYTLSKDNGGYEFRVPSGNYQVEQTEISNDIFGEFDCPTTDTVYNVTATTGSTIAGIDFINHISGAPPSLCNVGINIEVGTDLGLTNPCPGLTYHACVLYTNNGSTITSPTFAINLSPALGLIISNVTSFCCTTPAVSGQSITCTSATPFSANAICSICFDVFVPSPCGGCGGGITTTASINGTCMGNPLNQQASETTPADCAFDPNDKLSAPQGCGAAGNIKKDTTILYRVRFQNTGTASAQEVVIRDPLDSDLDITTLKILASSHSITQVEVIPDNALIISYESINLPDSGSNLQGSMGFVIFSIKPKSNLPDGTQITNQTGIYFDFNEVVLTNSTLNTLRDNPQPIADFDVKHSCTNIGLIYDFTYTGATADNAIFLWNFGTDATPSTTTEQNPTGIVFSSAGTKSVTLTVTRFGCTATISKNIEVISVITGTNNNQVIICHNGHAISVSQSALQAHLNHGDCIGPCVQTSKMSELYSTINQDVTFEAFPNPFIDKTEIIYSVPENCNIKIRVYNYLGDFVAELFNGEVQNSDPSKLYFNNSGLSAGIYYATLESTVGYKLIKLVVIK